MKLVFYAQVKQRVGDDTQLDIIRTTKHKPTGPEGQVIKFDIDIPEAVMYPEVKATLIGLETATDQAVTRLQNAAAAMRTKP